jgi:ribonuclease G
MRLPGPPERVLSDDVALLPALRAAFPQADVIRIDPQDSPVDLDAAFEAALAPTASLAGGGSIHIIEAEAATLIDVDTGSPEAGTAERAIAAINMEAARAIAHHMRLRQLGGGILVDFASLDARGPRERIRRELEKAIASDPAQPRLLGWSRLGHLEIVRPRRLRPLSDVLLSPPLRDKTPLAVAFEALRAVYRESRARPSAAWRLVVDADVEAALRGPAAAALRSLEERLGRKLEIARAAVGGSRVDIVET